MNVLVLFNIIGTFLFKFYTFYRAFNFPFNLGKKEVNRLITSSNKNANGIGVFEKVNSLELNLGDIIRLEKGDVAPTNLLVIEGYNGPDNPNKVLVDKFLVTEELKIHKKIILDKLKSKRLLASDMAIKKFSKSLNFTLEIMNNEYNEDFKGTIKFKKDPKTEVIGLHNLIEKETIIKSPWILGIVLTKEKYMSDLIKNAFKTTKIGRHKAHLNKIMLVITLFCSLFISGVKIYLRNFIFKDLFDIVFRALTLLPIGLNIFIDIVYLIQSFRLRQRYTDIKHNFKNNKIEVQHKKNKPLFHILNPNVLSNFKNIEYLVVSKNDFICKKELLVKSICTNDQYYNIKYEEGPTLEEEIIEEDSVESLDNEEDITENYNVRNDFSVHDIDKNFQAIKRLTQLKSNKLNSTIEEKTFTNLPPPLERKLTKPETHKLNSKNIPRKSIQKMVTSNNRKKSLLNKLISANSGIVAEENQKASNIDVNIDGKFSNLFLNKLQNAENSKLFNAIYKKWILNKGGQTSIKNEDVFDDDQISFKRSQTGVFKYKKLNIQNSDVRKTGQNFSPTDLNMMELLKNCLYSINPYLLYNGNDHKYYSQSYFENAILNICDKYQIEISKIEYFGKSKTINIGIRTFNDNTMFSMINSFTSTNSHSNKVFIIPSHEENITIYYKIYDAKKCEKIIDNNHTLNIIKKIISKNNIKNLDTVILLTRSLSDNESEEVHQLHAKLAKNKITCEQFNDLTEYLWCNMELHLCIGYKESFRKDFILFDQFKEANIKIAYLSRSNFNSCFNIAKTYKILRKETRQIRVNFTTEETGKLFFKELFNYYRDVFNELSYDKDIPSQRLCNFINDQSLFSYQQFTLFVQGSTLDLIIKDPYLFSNFTFLLQFMKEFIGYDFQPKHKKLMVEIFKKQSKTNSIMAIGDSEKDIKMLRKADISVLSVNKSNKKYFCDIITSDLSIISDLVFNSNYSFIDNVNKITNLVLFYLLLILSLTVCDYLVNEFNTSLFPNFPCIFIEYYIYSVYGIFYVFTNKLDMPQKLDLFKFIYQSNFIKVKLKRIVITVEVIEGIFYGAVLYFLIYAINDITFINGFPGTEAFFVFSISSGIVILLSMKLFILLTKQSKLLIVLAILGFLLHFLGFYLASLNNLILRINIYDFRAILETNYYWIALISIFAIFGPTIYIYDLAYRKFKTNLIYKFYKLYDIRNTSEIIFMFLAKWFKHSKNIFFPEILYKFSSMKNYLDPQVITFSYPFELLNKENILCKFSLKYKDKFLNNAWDLHISQKLKTKLLPFYLYILSILAMVFYLAYFSEKLNKNILHAYIILMALFFIFVVMIKNKLFLIRKLMNLLGICLWIITLITLLNNHVYLMVGNVLFIYTLTIVSHSNFVSLIIVISLCGISNIGIQIYYLFSDEKIKWYSIVAQLICLIIFMLIISLWRSYIERLKKEKFLSKNRLKHTSSFNNELLTLLMPKFVLNKINYDINENVIADDAGDVCIMFIELCDFNALTEGLNYNIITFLDELFRDYDIMCDKYGVQKIETVGKVYVACCGISFVENKLPNKIKSVEPVKRLLDLALALTNINESYFGVDGNKLNVKIGLHYGKCMMGVIGYHKPQFSLIGDTINTTSRVCATGVPGHIMMSEDFYKQYEGYDIKSGLTMEKVVTYMKGKGDIPVYHLYKKLTKIKNRLIRALSNSNKNPEKSNFLKLNIFKNKKNQNTNNEMFGKYNGFIRSISTKYKVNSSNKNGSSIIRDEASIQPFQSNVPQPSLNSIVNDNQKNNFNIANKDVSIEGSYNTFSVNDLNESEANTLSDYEVR